MSGAPATFDVCGPLPAGTTLLEASAGTGKTFTIAALATRYVAEGRAELSQLMLVTFGRAATQELRQRVRERLVATERALTDPAAARTSGDVLVEHLAAVSDEEVALRRRRLTAALADFDAATIATTHGFCHQMLAGLGVAGDTDPDATFIESSADLVDEVVDDLYLARFAAPGAPAPAMSATCARAVARRAVADPQAELAPPDADSATEAGQRYAFARDVRVEVDRRKRQRRLLDYDDLLIRLRDALADPRTGAHARQRVRSRYRVVMVDEFQDTDPVQWEILRLTFHGHVTLVLIGDPKQAIYAFRGADVVTYLQAAEAADTRATLGRNWRSDGPLLDALDVVFRGAALGDPRIVVRPVDAEHRGQRLRGGRCDAPMRVRLVTRACADGRDDEPPKVDRVRSCVAADVAGDVVRLLGSDATVLTGPTQRRVLPGDVAVLVRTNAQAALVREALQGAGVPVVLSGFTSVFATATAREWLVLLRALEQPHRAGRVRAAALTCFLGWTAEQLAVAGDAALDELGPLLRGWADVLAGRGVAALLEVVTAAGLQQRLLGFVTGERQLTDLRHIAQALHAAALGGQLGTAALGEWLRRRIAEADSDTSEERSRRLESDADAVQVLTVHTSKGLEFPVVYVPFGWDRWKSRNPDPLLLHAAEGTRVLDVSGPAGPHYKEHVRLHDAEEAGEDLRLLYVAMTRAQCQVVTWWAASHNTRTASTSRLLLGRFELGEVPPASVPLPRDDAALATLRELAARSGGSIVVESVSPGATDAPRRWQPPGRVTQPLAAARFDRQLDANWRRTSYSALTSALHHGDGAAPGVASEPDAPDLDDEAVPGGAAQPGDDGTGEQLRLVASPFADLPSGTAFGTLVHSVLEDVDTTAADLAAELLRRCTDEVARRLTGVDPARLAAALMPVLGTPLGPLADGLALRDIKPHDRLAELDFELPLAGGDRARRGDPALGDVARLLRRHVADGDPLAGYADLLDVPALRAERLRGYLSGSLDAVLRLRGRDGEPRYLVVDYKTNWLGEWGPTGAGPLTAWHYRPVALADAMLRAHYPLQLLLYEVALHRFLRWRQPGYDPDRHLGGGLYLFVRGMCGPGTPVVAGTPCGVFGWRPPAVLVDELSVLLAGGGGR